MSLIDKQLTGQIPRAGTMSHGITAGGVARPLLVNDDGTVNVSGGGTEYTEGDTDASITGTALMLEGAANTLVAAPGTAADGMLVNLGPNNDVRITDGAGIVNTKQIGTAITASDVGLVVQSVIHGLSSAGGGTYVDVKVNPSGALVTATTLNDGTDTALVTSAGELNVLESNSSAIKTAVETIDNAISGNEMQVDIVGSLPAGTNAIGTVDVTSAVITGGAVAHDGVDSGNPIKIGHKAVSTQSGQTAVASGDRTDSITDLDGSLITRMTTHGDSVSGVATTTGASDTSVVAAQGASTYFYVTGFSVANTGSTTTLITFKDGSGGSALWYTIAPAGGGSNLSQGGKPIFRTSANTALYFACASASTTVYVSVTGYKSKV